MEPLLTTLEAKVEAVGSITSSLDGRRVGIRHHHAALNSLLQSSGAVVMRWQPYFLSKRLAEAGVVWCEDYIPHLHVHDEVQGSLRPGLEDVFSAAVKQSFDDTRAVLGLRVRLDSEVKFGNNWADTH
jgi:DNA polymerase-1